MRTALLCCFLAASCIGQSGLRSPAFVGSLRPAGAAGSTLNNGLVSYWKLDEASGNRADSQGNNTLTDNGTVGSDTGIIGNAAVLDGDFLSKADDADFGFTTAFSLSFWMYRYAVDVNTTPISKWTYSTDGGWAIQTGSASAPDMTVFVATSATDNGAGCIMDFNDADQSVTTWYNMVLIYDGSLSGDANRLKLYQNGAQLTLAVGSGAVPATLVNDTADFIVGKWGGSLTRAFSGRVDAVGLWNRAITAGEVTELYNAGAGKTCCPFAAP